LRIQNIEDRVVSRALVEITRPILEPMFSPFSFGFRSRRSTWHALATALGIIQTQNLDAVATADVAQAFDNVPLAPMLQAWGMLFPPQIVNFVELISSTGKKRGIRQGAPHSPLCWNVFAHQHLDYPWDRHRAHLGKLLRYADDVLIPCRRSDAEEALSRLTALAAAAGTPLKPGSDIVRVDRGDALAWLGFKIQFQNGIASVQIAEKAWRRLERQLEMCHEHDAAPVRAASVVQGWIQYIAPCFEDEDPRAVIQQVRRTAGDLAFEELPSEAELLEQWRAAHARWQVVEKEQAELLPARLQTPVMSLARRSCLSRVGITGANQHDTGRIPAGAAATQVPASLATR
jgi:hypothetical protein